MPPTDLGDVVRVYRDGVGLTEIGSFQDHEGFDGVMLGVSGASYHLEFTQQRDHTVGRASTQENLLVFYLPSRQEWQAAIDRMVAAGYAPVVAYNPYWDRSGCTFEDPDVLKGIIDGHKAALTNGSPINIILSHLISCCTNPIENVIDSYENPPVSGRNGLWSRNIVEW